MRTNLIAMMLVLFSCALGRADDFGIEDLTRACREGDLVRVKKNVDARVDIDAKDKGGWFPLSAASAHGHADVAEYLLKEGADVNELSSKKNTPLIYAASRGHAEVVKLLLKSKADTKLKNVDGETASASAEQHGHQEVVKLIDAHDKKGR